MNDKPQCLIHRVGCRKRFCHIRRKQHKIRPLRISLRVFSPHSLFQKCREIVFRAQLIAIFWFGFCSHTFGALRVSSLVLMMRVFSFLSAWATINNGPATDDPMVMYRSSSSE